MRSPPSRLRLDAALARVGAALLLLTFVVPDWIEKVFGVAPDNGDGSAEWALVAILVVLTVVALISAGLGARRQSKGVAGQAEDVGVSKPGRRDA